jgi:hypothetical protein
MREKGREMVQVGMRREGGEWVEGKDEGERKGNGAWWNEEGRGRENKE